MHRISNGQAPESGRQKNLCQPRDKRRQFESCAPYICLYISRPQNIKQPCNSVLNWLTVIGLTSVWQKSGQGWWLLFLQKFSRGKMARKAPVGSKHRIDGLWYCVWTLWLLLYHVNVSFLMEESGVDCIELSRCQNSHTWPLAHGSERSRKRQLET